MNKIYKSILVLFSVFLIAAYLSNISGCSKEADNLTAPKGHIGFHPAGFSDINSINFHGRYIANTNDWYSNSCKQCHGADLKGGSTGVNCLTCHPNGLKECNLCHGNQNNIYPPKSLRWNLLSTEQGVGAHDKHLSSDPNARYSAQVQCTECHLQVINFEDTNHIGNGDGIAEVVFGTLAKTRTDTLNPQPTFDRSTGQCSNVYCHGYFKNGNLNFRPSFYAPNSVRCGSCHGNPTTNDPTPGGQVHSYNLPCYYCHGSVIDSSKVIINKAKHINGVVDFN